MNLKVLLFAHLRELAGTPEIEVSLPESASGNDLLDHLLQQYPEIKSYRDYLKLSMDGEYIENNQTLNNESEIAVIPPVSGG